MSVRIINSSDRLLPRSRVGKFAALEEVTSTMNHLKNLPPGKDVEIQVDSIRHAALKKDGVKDPARSIVNVLRRKFLTGGLPFKAYASDDKTITVIRDESVKAKAPVKK